MNQEQPDSIKLGGGGRIACLLKRLSPFEFATLKEFPWPTWAVVFAVVFSYLLTWQVWYRFDYFFDGSILHRTFVTQQLDSITRQTADIILVGSSLARSLDLNTLEYRTGRKSLRFNAGNANPWVSYRLFEKYERFVDKPRILLMDFSSGFFDNPSRCKIHRHYLQNVGRRTDFWCRPYEWNRQSFTEKFFPKKQPLRSFASVPPSYIYFPASGTSLADLETQHQRWLKQVSSLLTQSAPQLKSVWLPDDKSFTNSPLLEEMKDIATRCHKKGILLVIFEDPHVEPFAANGSDPITLAARARRKEWFQQLKSHENIVLIENDEYHLKAKHLHPATLVVSDGAHMTTGGTVFYANWLCNKMLSNPRICAQLRRPMNMPGDEVNLDEVIAQWRLKPPGQVASPLEKTKVR